MADVVDQATAKVVMENMSKADGDPSLFGKITTKQMVGEDR